jgi:hypothetical protein
MFSNAAPEGTSTVHSIKILSANDIFSLYKLPVYFTLSKLLIYQLISLIIARKLSIINS